MQSRLEQTDICSRYELCVGVYIRILAYLEKLLLEVVLGV